jgi:hypothetical protein
MPCIPDSQSNRIENTLHIQIHNLCKGIIRMGIKLLTPRRSRIREQDINMISRLADFGNQMLDAREFCAVGWNGNGFRAGLEIGKGVEGCHGFVAGVSFAGGDVDFGCACLEESGSFCQPFSFLSSSRGKALGCSLPRCCVQS